MARKLKPLTRTQTEILQAHGLKPHEWRLVKDLSFSIIVQLRISGEHRVLEKSKKL